MPIQSNQIILRRGGAINADQTLCTIFNTYINNNSQSKMISKIINVDFLSQSTTRPLSLRLKIKTGNTFAPLNHDLNQLKNLFALEDDLIEVIKNEFNQTVEINISDAHSIINLFQQINYEYLLDSNDICLAFRVDLLQLLITDTLCWLIKKSKISPYAPELIEFNTSGELTAIVISPTNKKYQLNNMNEICGFFKQYCSFELPPYFIGLMRQQQKINTARYAHYLTTSGENEIPRIFADNQFNEVKFCTDTQSISFGLVRRDNEQSTLNVQERRIFQMLFEHCLGPDFVTKWHLTVSDYKLVLSGAQQKALTVSQLSILQNILTQFNLLSNSLNNNFLADQAQPSETPTLRELPESIANLLRCPISYSLPKKTPYITPTGQSYDQDGIQNWLAQRPIDPMNPGRNLTSSMLRENKLLAQLINYYHQSSTNDALANPPALLMLNPRSGEFYKNPVVTETGETQEYMGTNYYPEYVNRAILDLIKFYEVILTPRNEAIIRTGIRATIGANLSVICPGYGALSEAEAKDETETSLPYPEYEAQSDTFIVYFISQEYARRFELALLQWHKEQTLVIAEGEVEMQAMQTFKTILNVHGKKEDLMFTARVLIRGEKNIINVLEHLCNLPAAHYFNAIKKLSALSDTEELLNDITHAVILQNFKYDWGNEAIRLNSLSSTMPMVKHKNIFSMRSASDRDRFYFNELPTIDEETEEELEELDFSRLKIKNSPEIDRANTSRGIRSLENTLFLEESFNYPTPQDSQLFPYEDGMGSETLNALPTSTLSVAMSSHADNADNCTQLRRTRHVHFFNSAAEETQKVSSSNCKRGASYSSEELITKRAKHK